MCSSLGPTENAPQGLTPGWEVRLVRQARTGSIGKVRVLKDVSFPSEKDLRGNRGTQAHLNDELPLDSLCIGSGVIRTRALVHALAPNDEPLVQESKRHTVRDVKVLGTLSLDSKVEVDVWNGTGKEAAELRGDQLGDAVECQLFACSSAQVVGGKLEGVSEQDAGGILRSAIRPV